MTKARLSKRITSMLLSVILLLTCIPLSAAADTTGNGSGSTASTDVVTDPGTAYTWETMMGTEADGNRYAGRVWVDKSVYKNGDTAVLNTKGDSGSSFQVALEEDEAFQVIFSALGSTMTTTSTTTSTGPMDVVLVLDTSTSMDDTSNGVTRLQRVIEASNELLKDLATVPNVRIAIVTYNKDSETVLPLASYNNGIKLVVTDYYNNGSSDAGVVTAYDNSDNKLGNDSGFTSGTNLQSGIDRGFNILANAADVEGRVPVAIVLTDGRANRASEEGFYEISTHDDKDGTGSYADRNLYLSTLLNAAYNKTKIEEHYGKDANVYTIGVDIGDDDEAQMFMNPGDAENGFKSYGNDRSKNEITQAYTNFQKWATGADVTHDGWTFDHNYPKQNGAITAAKIAANINYADTYYDVSNAEIESTFQQIYEELSSGVFNPISSSTTVEGGTGAENTPLIYVDFIGQYMEIKEIQAVTLFGASYGVIKNGNGTYTVDAADGTNPTTNEPWNTAEDILITVTEQTDGTQKLEIKINQEILPIIMEQAISKTVGGVTSATITEYAQAPLRVYYTVGIDSEILLPNGDIDVSEIKGYQYIDDTNGTVSFYSNQFGVLNPTNSSEGVIKGDAHVGFMPSAENRFYYHQANQGIFTKITNKADNSPVVIEENNEYGIVWDENKYDLTWMTYDEYTKVKDTDKVYTYVTYYRPTPDTADAANAAEEVTYLVYTDWKYLKESVTFYDANTGTYLNGGKVIAVDQVATVIAAYMQSNPQAKLYAVLGVGSRRTSRLHNMTIEKWDTAADESTNYTGTAKESYTPEYLEQNTIHYGNDVIVWLGNNGKITVPVETGIALTKEVTEPISNAEDQYELTVTVPAGVNAAPVVKDADGNTVESTYANNILTVKVKADQTVYVIGIPAGTVCSIGENINSNDDYHMVVEESTSSVTIPTLSQVLATTNSVAQYVPATVTNAPNKYGNLFITKKITSDHAVPDSILSKAFAITVNVGTALAGKTYTVNKTDSPTTSATVDADGNMKFQIAARQTIEILRLPEGTKVSVVETDPGSCFGVSYAYTDANTDNELIIPANGDATAVVYNRYTPASTTVKNLDIKGTKNFTAEGNHDGGKFIYQVQRWDGTAWEDISGKTAETSYGVNESGTKTFLIEDVLAGITYTEVGNYAYQVVEVKGNVANVTYDRTLYTFNVTVTDDGGQLVAKVTNWKGDTIDPITDPVTGSYSYEVTEVIFNNTYHTAPVSIDIKKEVVNNSGDDTVSKAGFAFKAVPTDANWNELTNVSSLTVYSDAAGEARLTATYENAGSYFYKLKEVIGNALNGWAYSGAEYRIRVDVTVSGNDVSSGNATVSGNDLVASLNIEKQGTSNNDAEKAIVSGDTATVSFVNTYDPDDVPINLDGKVSKVLTGKTLKAEDFKFFVYEDGDRTNPILTGTNDLNGNVNFVDFDKALTFSSVGRYQYDVVESIPDGAVYNEATGKYVLNGMSYDPTIYDLVVEVTNDSATGKLVANDYFEDSVDNVVTFNNSYKATPTEYALGGVKVLHGRAPKVGEFAFALYEGNSETVKETVTNKGDGTFEFSPINYTEAGTYTYTIKEVAGDVKGVTYDGVNKPITVKVIVTDTNGVLSASAQIGDDVISNADIKFENTYTAAPVNVNFGGNKKLVGSVPTGSTFTFKLYPTDNSYDITKSPEDKILKVEKQSGDFAFEAVEFKTPGTYFFVIAEEMENPIADVVYDGTQHKFAVNVSDIGDGQLKAVVTNVETGKSSVEDPSVPADISFTNATFDEVTEKEVYLEGNTETEIDGKKVKEGDILTYFISYKNYTGKDVVVDIMDTIPEHTTYVEGSASGNGTYAGTHVNWILDVRKGEAVEVSFQVKVNDTQAIVSNEAVVRDGINTYTTNEVVNHTVDEVLVKDVFSPGDTTVSIDGKKVYEGDELLYTISFTNATGSAADITITDSIPENTTYVAGSADNGGVYADGAIEWNITAVPAWATVTVSFKVTVNANIGDVPLTNVASATDGTNDYTSNLVINYTVDDEVDKQVFKGDNTLLNIDGKKVNIGDELVYTITYKNTAKETATVTITDSIPQYTTYVDGSADNGGVYNNGVITWTKDVAAEETLTVSFKVVVSDNAVEKTIANKATIVEGKNSYTTKEVTNYTVEDEVEKKVFKADNTQLNIDCKQVYEGDELVYTITYKNTARETATVTITDTVPQYTTYVDGSADNGGVYKEGVITWTKDVAANTAITVSFKVKVNANIGAKIISNEATIVEGENSYITNKVVNYTFEEKGDTNTDNNNDNNTDTTDNSGTPTTSTTGSRVDTGDTSDLWLWFALLFICGGVLVGTVIYGKKKKVTEK